MSTYLVNPFGNMRLTCLTLHLQQQSQLDQKIFPTPLIKSVQICWGVCFDWLIQSIKSIKPIECLCRRILPQQKRRWVNHTIGCRWFDFASECDATTDTRSCVPSFEEDGQRVYDKTHVFTLKRCPQWCNVQDHEPTPGTDSHSQRSVTHFPGTQRALRPSDGAESRRPQLKEVSGRAQRGQQLSSHSWSDVTRTCSVRQPIDTHTHWLTQTQHTLWGRPLGAQYVGPCMYSPSTTGPSMYSPSM